MPSVFNKIDSCMKAAYDGSEVLGAVLATKNVTVKSTPVSVTPTIELVIGGRLNASS